MHVLILMVEIRLRWDFEQWSLLFDELSEPEAALMQESALG